MFQYCSLQENTIFTTVFHLEQVSEVISLVQVQVVRILFFLLCSLAWEMELEWEFHMVDCHISLARANSMSRIDIVGAEVDDSEQVQVEAFFEVHKDCFSSKLIIV